jgi:hypothetical protein
LFPTQEPVFPVTGSIESPLPNNNNDIKWKSKFLNTGIPTICFRCKLTPSWLKNKQADVKIQHSWSGQGPRNGKWTLKDYKDMPAGQDAKGRNRVKQET